MNEIADNELQEALRSHRYTELRVAIIDALEYEAEKQSS